MNILNSILGKWVQYFVCTVLWLHTCTYTFYIAISIIRAPKGGHKDTNCDSV